MVLNAEQRSCIGIPFFQVGERMWNECVVCDSVGAVWELEWVQGDQDDGVVSHDQPFKEFHGKTCDCYGVIVIRQVTLMFLVTGTMVVCFEQVGITDRVKDSLSVKTLASLSAHASSTHPGIPYGPRPCKC
jgi:hypothetical protein